MKRLFITSIGRSGTTFLTDLLNQPEIGQCFIHEPFKIDSKILQLEYEGCYSVYLEDLYKWRFDKLEKQFINANILGEVNPYLRYSLDYLKKNFDTESIILVRNGKSYVQSAFNRGVYGPYDKQARRIPKDHDAYAAEWHEFGQFEKICWNWATSTNYLIGKSDNILKLEEITSNYDYLLENFLEKYSVKLDFERWAKFKDTKVNTNFYVNLKSLLINRKRSESIGSYRDWTENQKQAFNTICGSVMNELNYE